MVVVVIEMGETKEEREVVMVGGGTVVSKCGNGKGIGGVEVKAYLPVIQEIQPCFFFSGAGFHCFCISAQRTSNALTGGQRGQIVKGEICTY